MARTVSTVCELFKANEASYDSASGVQGGVTPVAIAKDTAVYIPAIGRTMVIGITPVANGEVEVAAGDGVAAMNNLTFAVTKDKISFICLDTSSFEIIDPADDNVGSIKLTLKTAATGTLVAVNAL